MSPLRPLAAVLICTAAAPAAEGTRLLGIGPAQEAFTGAGAAASHDVTWIALNPAGLADLGPSALVAGEVVHADVELDLRDAPPGLANVAAGEQHDHRWIPAFFAGADGRWGDTRLALAAYTVSGLAVEWAHSKTTIGEAGGFDRTASAGLNRLAFAAARRIGGLRLGAALDLDYSTFRSDALTFSLSETAGDNRVDTALGAGAILGAAFDWESVSIGLDYHTRHWVQAFDRYDDLLAGPLDQPPVAQGGIAVRLGGGLVVLADARWIGWHSVRVYRQTLGWDDQRIGKLALQWTPVPALSLRAGASYGDAPIDGDAVLLNGLSPLVSEWHLGGGVAWRFAERFEAQAAYQRALPHRETDNGGDLGGAGTGARIGLTTDALVLGVSLRF